jgi:hypothetical protein
VQRGALEASSEWLVWLVAILRRFIDQTEHHDRTWPLRTVLSPHGRGPQVRR